MKTLIRIIIAFVLAAVLFSPVQASTFSVEPETAFAVERLETFVDDNISNYTLEELEELISQYQEIRHKATELAKHARLLGWPQDCEAIQSANAESYNATLAIKVYQTQKSIVVERMEQEKWNQYAKEYPAATAIWLYMKDLGWNDYVCAGVMGNIMAEVGGGTLDVKYWVAGGNGWFYGMCQWSKYYCPEVYGVELIE